MFKKTILKLKYLFKTFINNENNNLKHTLQNYDNYIFISPHFDDAIFSSFYLLRRLKNLNKNVVIVTLFTKTTSRPYSQQAIEFLKSCNYTNGKKLFADRKREDIKVSSLLGNKYIHFNYVDGAWRKNKKGRLIYKNPTEQNSGKISSEDKALVKDIVTSLLKKVLIKLKNVNTLVLSPLGTGNHIDHLVTFEAIKNLNFNKLYWQDYPYNLKSHNNKRYKLQFWLEDNFSKKEKAIRIYKSQISCLFPDNIIPQEKERYYLI